MLPPTPFDLALDGALLVWFGLSALAAGAVAVREFSRPIEQSGGPPVGLSTRVAWVLFVLFTGPIGFALRSLIRGRRNQGGLHLSRWRQAAESTVHCVAGDATGVVLAAVAARWFRPSLAGEFGREYCAGFLLGLLLFQAPALRASVGDGYWRAVRRALFPEFLSMNAVMAAMVPVMSLLMSGGTPSMDSGSIRFWGVMALAFIAGSLVAFPVNWWLVAEGATHVHGASARSSAAARGPRRALAAALTLLLLGAGAALGARGRGMVADVPATRPGAVGAEARPDGRRIDRAAGSSDLAR